MLNKTSSQLLNNISVAMHLPNYIKNWILLVFLCLFTIPSHAEEFSFQSLTTRNGLSSDQVNYIYKDSRGFLWIGTVLGLSRYDGFRFRSYFTQLGNEQSLPGCIISEILEDAMGRLWLKSNYSYSIFDPKTEICMRDPKGWLKQHGIKGDPGYVYADVHRNLWISVNNVGCYYYNFATDKVSFMPQGKGHGKLPTGIINDIQEINDGIVIAYNDGTLAKFNPHTHQVIWVNRYLPQNVTQPYRSYQVFVDRLHNYWVYTGEMAYYFNAIKKTWKTIDLMVKAVIQDSDNRIWIATDHEGVLLQDEQGNTIKHFKNDRANPRSLPDNTIQCLYPDEWGTMWIGTYKNGLAYYYKGQTAFKSVDIGDVCTIAEDLQKNLWCGTNDNGIICCSPSRGTTAHYSHAGGQLGSDIVVSSLTARDGSMWLGTYRGGLTHYKNGNFETFRQSKGGLCSDNIWSLAEDSYGNIYIGTLGRGLQVYNPTKRTFRTYDTRNSGLQSDDIFSLSFNPNEDLLIGHSNNFSKLNIHTNRISNYNATRSGKPFSSTVVNQIMCDSRGIIWLATASGLNAYDPKTDQLSVVEVSEAATNAEVEAISEDRHGYIWVSASNIVSRVSVRNENNEWHFYVNSFSESDGLQSRIYNKRSMVLSSDGNIIVGGMEGISFIAPQQITMHKNPAHVLFSGLTLFDHQLAVGEKFNHNVIMEEDLNISRHIELNYNYNAFTIQLASANLSIPETSRFIYRLKGFSNRWLMTSEGQASVTFTNLEPSKYTLEVRTVDYNGVPLSPVSSLTISIKPPFYRLTLAYIIYTILLIALVFYLYKALQRRRKAAQARIELEKEKEIDASKQIFFININHELRTPLTLILSPLASIIREESNDEIRKKLQLIHRNALKLLEMVNQMLDLRRLMVKGEQLKTTHGEVVQFIHSICDQFLELSDKHITLTFYSSMEKLMMDFDRDKLTKIISNLLSNAFKFTPDHGRVDVSLSLENNDTTESKDLVIKVMDNGIGIKDEDKTRIFERFYQAENNHPSGGSGIGLNIVQEYVTLHGGKVHVEDNPGGGAVFILTLPATHSQVEGNEFVESEESVVTDIQGPLSEAKDIETKDQRPKPVVLLVDDSNDFLEFMQSEMEANFTILIAHDGVEALQCVDQEHPDIILTDVMMPEMDGNELCTRLKSDVKTASIPVIMLTARLAEENEIESLKCGADEYITKPFNLDILYMYINKLLKRHNIGSNGKIKPQISRPVITSLDEKLVQNATAYIESQLDNTELSVEMLSESLGMSRVNLYRKLLSATGKTPSEFIRLIRLRHAEQLLMKSQLSISEIAYSVGFSSSRYFSKCYKELYGYLPSQYSQFH